MMEVVLAFLIFLGEYENQHVSQEFGHIRYFLRTPRPIHAKTMLAQRSMTC
jgi:hypothetical protein